MALFSLGARFGIAWGLVFGAAEMPVAPAAAAAAGDGDLLAGGVQVGQEDFVVIVEDEGAGGDFDQKIFAAGAGHLFAHPAFAAAGFPMVAAGEIEEGV